MKYESYNHAEIEPEILKFWEEKKIVEKLRERNKHGEKFYFLKGPPYTSGRIHLGHAWNMALKDMVLRYKRMKGFKVWDRMGYDMHGLPTEVKVMKKFNLKNKEAIEEFGVKKFTEECGKYCVEMMGYMNDDFKRVGATLDFTDPYQPISQSFMEAEWWLIKKAHEKGRLYQGLRTMHWDAATQTSVAKHELEYKSVTDTSIFVKFQLVEKPNTYFIIWTTTPWTIPLNLAVMVNPELDYVDVDADGETWIVAKNLVESVMKKAEVGNHKILREFKGEEMEGWTYHHPLNLKQNLPEDLQQNPKLYSVLLTKEYVDDSAGTGLVHSAPGCGPEDYEVGHKNGIPPFNCVNEGGFFENFGSLTGLKAKTDDKKFITEIEKSGALIAKEPYTHDYPYGERSKEPVIFRTTKQWFFKVEDLKEKMLAANEDIIWNPKAAKNAYKSWLENLRDNSITKQRYWGTAVPIWSCKETDEHIVVGSVKELEELSGQKVTSMHIPDIDHITITKDGKTFKRMPDVLDVWIDAGTVSWNCLRYPEIKEDFEEMFPADFILEGKDQIRGWFNLLMVASMLAFEKPSFKNVVMHGFINDNSGVKMSKSLGNIIQPFELIDKHGADTLRFYTCQTSAGMDLNFSWEEAAHKSRGISILWNVHKLLINLGREQGIKPFELDATKMHEAMGAEEKYIVSKLHSTIKKVGDLMDNYRIDEIIAPLEDLFLEISRTYIQMVRDKSTMGSTKEKQVVVYTLATTVFELLKMFQLVAPFSCEAMFQNFKEEFGFKEESISHLGWPKY
ncbi:isoleucine--tRNA ligase, partial [Candidatus Woesearchaeota archaeon]|nr:isoleucine--tRNA ligase [Candidatus Woesearchaeota archaeon]